jgi:hypothetical protein
MGMTTIIRKNLTKTVIRELFRNILPRKKFDAQKYCGIIQLNIDPLKYQRPVRDEWQ